MRQYYIPLPHGFQAVMPEGAARAYVARIMDQQDHYWLVRRVEFDDAWQLQEARFKTLREALAWGIWQPEILEHSGVDVFHAVCFLAELDLLECSDEAIWDAPDLPPLWERLGSQYAAVQ